MRELRVELARALAADSGGRSSRLDEAIGELTAALGEAGDVPSEAQIHLLSAQLAEHQDPVAALQSYIEALGDSAVDQPAAAGALALVERDTDGQAAVAGLPPAHLQRLEASARAGYDPRLCVLAARVMRMLGNEPGALELLRESAATSSRPPTELLVELATVLLELDRPDDVLSLVERSRDRGGLETFAARAHLLRGDYANALAVLDRAGASDGSEHRMLRALALTGAGDPAGGLATVRDQDGPMEFAATTVIALIAEDYEVAANASAQFLRSSPTDPNALILDAQVRLEGIETFAAAVPDQTAAEVYRTSLALLRAAVGGTAIVLERLWWLKVQGQLRGDSGRFQFFRLQVRLCRDDEPTEQEWHDVDTDATSSLQEAVIAEAVANHVRERGPADEAANAFVTAALTWQRDEVRDGKQAYRCAQTAFDIDPTPDHAADLAYALVFDTYRTQDLHRLAETIDVTFRQTRRFMPEATGDALMTLTCANAWLAGRQFEIARRDKQNLGITAAQWLVLAAAFQRSDPGLNSLLGSMLRTLGHHDAAAYYAARAMDESRSDFTTSTMVICLLDHSAYDEVEELLDDPSLAGEPAWTEAIRLACRLYQGDVGDIREPVAVGLEDIAWARTYIALASALRDGFAAAQPVALAVLEQVDEYDPGFDELLLSLLFQSPMEQRELYDRALASENLARSELAMCDVLIRWAHTPDMSLESAMEAFLRVAPRVCDVHQFINVDAPLIVAKKQGLDRPAEITVDESAVTRRLQEIRSTADQWPRRFEEIAPGLGAVVPLGDSATFTADVVAAGAAATAALEDRELNLAAAELTRRATRVSLEQTLRRQVLWCVGRGEPDELGVELMLEPDRDISDSERIAALLTTSTGEAQLKQLVADSSPETLDAITGKLVEAGTEAIGTQAEFWAFLDRLRERSDALPGWDSQGLRDGLLTILDGTLGLSDVEPGDLRSPFSFAIGTAFVPDDTGPDWELFRDLVPAMKARVQADTGFEMPGCFVRADYGAPDALWLLANNGAYSAMRLPTHGWIVPGGGPDAHWTDPVSGRRMAMVDDVERPPDGVTPLEFLARHVEVFARDRLPAFVNFWDVDDLIGADDPLRERLLSDPASVLGAIDSIREAMREGRYAARDDLRRSIADQATRRRTATEEVAS